MGFENDPAVQVESGDHLIEILRRYTSGPPRIVILHADGFGTLQIGIGGPWGGLAYFGETHADMVAPTVPVSGEWANFPYYGQPCSVSPDEVFESAVLVRVVHHVFTHRAFPQEVTLRPM
jgi:hypothetical protein